ncbi:MAG: peptidoglycan-binding domain-containing protein [Marinobacter sp.]
MYWPGGRGEVSRGGHIAPLALLLLIAVFGGAWLWYMPANDSLLADDLDVPVVSGEIERAADVDEEDLRELPAVSADEVGLQPEAPAFDFGRHTQSLPAAFGALFDLWGEAYDVGQFPAACEFASTVGLGCLQQQGSRRSLEFLNRPAILQLRNAQGETGYVVLRSLNDDEAVIELAGETREIPFRQLEGYWFGDFQVLWRIPEYMSGDGFFGGSSGEQLWMDARMMQLADRVAESSAESARIKRLTTREQVRWYQKARGLTVDGIAGPMTIIQINNDLGTDVPRLVAARVASNG